MVGGAWLVVGNALNSSNSAGMTKTLATRRSFIWTAGAALSAPLAAGATVPAQIEDDHSIEDRLAFLEDVKAIRALNQAYAGHINGRTAAAAAVFSRASA